MGNEFTKLAKQLDASVVYIRADYTPKVDAQRRTPRRRQQTLRIRTKKTTAARQEGQDLFQRFFGNHGGGGRR